MGGTGKGKADEGGKPLRDPDARRQQILRAAVLAFADRGYAHVTLKEIGDVAGVTPALIVRYFGSKRELFERVAHWHAQTAEEWGEFDAAELATGIVDFWLDADSRAPALALVRSIDLDGGALFRRELEDRIRRPLRPSVEGTHDAPARLRLLESVIMGVGLFGLEFLVGGGGDDSPESIEALRLRLQRILEVCVAD